MSETRENCEENVEIKYHKFKDFGNKVYQEYEELHKLLCSQLNASHLDPLAKILLEHENIVLNNQGELMETVRSNLETQMEKSLNNLWQSNAVSEALISLEILKEKFLPYESCKWNLHTKTPLELTRPIRMHYKENRLRYLQTQLNFQNKQLNDVLQETEDLRNIFRDVKQQRNFLIKNIEESREKIQLAKAKIIVLQQQMLSNNNEDVNIENKEI